MFRPGRPFANGALNVQPRVRDFTKKFSCRRKRRAGLGSTRASRVVVCASRTTFPLECAAPILSDCGFAEYVSKLFGEAPKRAREARALPGQRDCSTASFCLTTNVSVRVGCVLHLNEGRVATTSSARECRLFVKRKNNLAPHCHLHRRGEHDWHRYFHQPRISGGRFCDWVFDPRSLGGGRDLRALWCAFVCRTWRCSPAVGWRIQFPARNLSPGSRVSRRMDFGDAGLCRAG